MKFWKKLFEDLNKKQKGKFKDCSINCKASWKKWEKNESLTRKAIYLFFKVLERINSSGRHIGEINKSNDGFIISVTIESSFINFTEEDAIGKKKKGIIFLLDVKNLFFNVKINNGRKLIKLIEVKEADLKILIEKIRLVYGQEKYIECW